MMAAALVLASMASAGAEGDMEDNPVQLSVPVNGYWLKPGAFHYDFERKSALLHQNTYGRFIRISDWKLDCRWPD